jgi:hypothetical protein
MTPWSETDLDSEDPAVEDDDFDDWDDDIDEEGPDELEFGEDESSSWMEDDAEETTGW